MLAHDGQAALEAISNYHLHAIVLDVILPILSGFEVLSRMRQDNGRVPTILLTARDRSQDVVHGLDLGADDYLTKPFEKAVLVARLRLLRKLQQAKRVATGILTGYARIATQDQNLELQEKAL